MYHYYQCVTNRRDKSCNKKTVQKDYIENLVIDETRKLLTKENIDRIAVEVVKLCEKERNNDNVKRLQKQLNKSDKEMANLTQALKLGKAIDFVLGEIEKLKKERTEIEQQILVENVQHPALTVSEVKFFMEQFKKGDVDDIKYRKALIDTFINKIYLYDDKMTILFNSQDSHCNVNLDDLCSSKDTLRRNDNFDTISVMLKSPILWAVSRYLEMFYYYTFSFCTISRVFKDKT